MQIGLLSRTGVGGEVKFAQNSDTDGKSISLRCPQEKLFSDLSFASHNMSGMIGVNQVRCHFFPVPSTAPVQYRP